MASTIAGSALGMVFWVLAARLFSRALVGRDSTLITVLLEVSTVCQISMGTMIARFLALYGRRRHRLVLTAYGASIAAAIGLGILIAFGAPLLSTQLRVSLAGTGTKLALVAGLALWGIYVLEDAVLAAIRKSSWVPAETLGFGVLKLAALPILALIGARHAIFLAWVLPLVAVVVPINVLIFRRLAAGANEPEADELEPPPVERGRVLRFVARDYLGSVCAQVAVTLVPALVLVRLGPEAAAYFGIAFTIALAFDSVIQSAGTPLVAELTRAPERLGEVCRTLERRIVAVVLPATAIVAIAAPLVLLPFGSAYADRGATVMRLLIGAGAARAVLVLFASVARAAGRTGLTAAVEASASAVVLVAAALLVTPLGVDGVGLAWLVGNWLIAALVLPWLHHATTTQSAGNAVGRLALLESNGP